MQSDSPVGPRAHAPVDGSSHHKIAILRQSLRAIPQVVNNLESEGEKGRSAPLVWVFSRLTDATEEERVPV